MRPIEKPDAARLAEIHKLSFEDFWTENTFAKMLACENYFGFIDDDGRGFILCSKICDEIEIITFCVSTEARNKKIGQKLLKELQNFAEELKVAKIFLEVNENNTIARHLYSSLGYEQISIRKNYYKGKNAVVMCFKLTKN